MAKLVEVTLPVEEISAACRRDKDRKTGTIKNVHKWFAPMPTPAWRALLFATLVDDPGDEAGREKLKELIKRLVPADGGPPDDDTLTEAKAFIAEATGGNPPTVFDPFCGGGSTLIEAQRLGLPAAGSDLNPVPVLITRTLTELLPQVAGRPALVGDPSQLKGMGGGPLDGFLADCRHYAERVSAEVWDKVGHLYPSPPGGGTIVAWLWARTVVCPNPACQAIAPLVSSFWLSKKKGALTWIEPTDLRPGRPVGFTVKSGGGGPQLLGSKLGRGGTFRCVVCKEVIPETHVKAEGKAGRLGAQLMAVAIDGAAGRRYLAPSPAMMPIEVERPRDAPDVGLSPDTRAFWTTLYGDHTFADVFTSRQLLTLGAFADTVASVPEWVRADGGDTRYSEAVTTVLGLCVSKLATTNSKQARWYLGGTSGSTRVQAAFSRHALPMVWDFVELNPFSEKAANWLGMVDAMGNGLRRIPTGRPAKTFQADARDGGRRLGEPALIATDPPYFAQIGYADLSDYFYVWLRRALRAVHPDLFVTVATPKADELIAAPYRHGGSMAKATEYFIDGFTETFSSLSRAMAPDLPMLIVYAHRQDESDDAGSMSSTAWDAMLSAIIAAKLRVVGTWPIHATTSNRQIGQGTNSLASYMVLVCRPQVTGAKPVDRQGFVAALHAELPRAIRKLQEGDLKTIDLGPAAIGPGMEVFSRYSRVIDTTGSAMTVKAALDLISQVTAEVLDEFVGDLDNETRWAMGWFREHGFDPGAFDDAQKVFVATNSSLEGVKRAGIATDAKGKVRLLRRDELPAGWTPQADRHLTVWEVTQHLVRTLDQESEAAAAELLAGCGQWAEAARDLAQWLAATSLSTGRSAEAQAQDLLVTSWSQLVKLAEQRRPAEQPTQGTFDDVGTVDG